jgi:hypothetical protein
MVTPTAIKILMWVGGDTQSKLFIGSRNNRTAAPSTRYVTPNTNIKVVIENMSILLGGEDKNPGLPLKVSSSYQCSPDYSSKAWFISHRRK